MEATERAATARTTERQVPAQSAQAEEGQAGWQATQQEGGPGTVPPHHGAPLQRSREERDKSWMEGYEAARRDFAQFRREARARAGTRGAGGEPGAQEQAGTGR
eukprot:7100666-Heterocapsa_arctica.AAC.1